MIERKIYYKTYPWMNKIYEITLDYRKDHWCGATGAIREHK
jgi:hypothetical protein